MARFDLSDKEWALIELLLPILGRVLPGRYCPHATVYNRYVRWVHKGVW